MADRVKSEAARVEVYDWLRLIATVFVVLGHSTYLYMETTYGGVMYELPYNINEIYYGGFLAWCREVASWVYGFHMPLFFMLSGAVLALKPMGSFNEIVRSKSKRLLIPYFLCGWLFMLPIKRIGGFYTDDTLREALKGFLEGYESGHLWFLTALFWCIIIYVAIYKILERLNVKSVYVMLLLAGIIQLTYTYIPFDVLGFKTGLSYIFYFALGYVFEIERKSNEVWNNQKTMMAYGVMLCLQIANNRYYVLNGFFTIILGSFMTYILADLCSRFFKNITQKKGWKIVVRNLFYVYLFHDPLQYIILRIFMKSGETLLSSRGGCILYVLTRTVGTFSVSILLGEITNRLKKYLGKVLK